MALSYVGSSTTAADSGSSIVITKHASLSSGNLMIAMFAIDGRTITSVPSGWTLIGNMSAGSNYYAYYKIAGSSEPTDYTWELSASCTHMGSILVYSGDFNTSDLINVTSNTKYITNNEIVKAASMTTDEDNCYLFFIASSYSPKTNEISAPSGFKRDFSYPVYQRYTQSVSSSSKATAGSTGDMYGILQPIENSTNKHAFAIAVNTRAQNTSAFLQLF